jgi:hypothetical protein
MKDQYNIKPRDLGKKTLNQSKRFTYSVNLKKIIIILSFKYPSIVIPLVLAFIFIIYTNNLYIPKE